MKSLIFTLLLLLSFTQGYKLVRREIKKDITKDVFLIFKGWIESWKEHGENMGNITACYNSTEDVAKTVTKIVRTIKRGKFNFTVVVELLGDLFTLTKELMYGYNICKDAGGLFIEMINRLKKLALRGILARIIDRIYDYNDVLWKSFLEGMDGIMYRDYYNIGHGFGNFIEVLLLMNDE